MCGFVGFAGGKGDKKALIGEMLDKIRHRGPDSQESFCDDGVALGFARLSIIDLEGGTQPLFNEDESKVLIFNGEIYNFKELREDLASKGHTFRTHTDSEVILHGYEEYGTDIVQKLRGMFAFAIWDRKTKKIFGARDHFGIKPYYYASMNGVFFFGSEIKSFLPHPQFIKELHEEMLPNYLTFACVPGYDTFFKGVYNLPPAHYFIYENGAFQKVRYFIPSLEPDTSKTLEFYEKEIANVLNESVTAHQIADVEVGCFLSSGVDSSYVAYELSKMQKVRTYTVGYEEKKYSEAMDAKVLADEIGVENFVREVSSEEYFANLGKVQYHLDEPLANPSANLLYFLSQRAGEDVKVVLSGEGADEMFGGYNVYKEPFALAKYQKLPAGLRRSLSKWAEKQGDFKGRNYIIRGGKTVEERYIGNHNIFSVEERKSLLKKNYNAPLPQSFTKGFYEEAKGLDDVSKMQYIDIHIWMVQEILLKADKMSMAHSLELRVPFLDRRVFECARTVPGALKASPENTKLALRQAALTKMNRDSANRVKKAFPLPLSPWLMEDRYHNAVLTAFESKVAGDLFDTKQLVQLLQEHKAGKTAHVNKIWAVYTFLLWYQEYFPEKFQA